MPKLGKEELFSDGENLIQKRYFKHNILILY